MKNVMRIDFTSGCCNSDGELVKGTERPVSIIFNRTVITAEEVYELINTDAYELDNRIIVTTPIRADNLKGKEV